MNRFRHVSVSQKTMLIFLTLFIYLLFQMIFTVTFGHLYLFQWTMQHRYLFIPLISIILILLNKNIISFSITAGNLIGVIVGQIAGDKIRAFKMQQIAPSTNAETRHLLQTHYGVPIWLLLTLLFAITGAIITLYLSRKKNLEAL